MAAEERHNNYSTTDGHGHDTDGHGLLGRGELTVVDASDSCFVFLRCPLRRCYVRRSIFRGVVARPTLAPCIRLDAVDVDTSPPHHPLTHTLLAEPLGHRARAHVGGIDETHDARSLEHLERIAHRRGSPFRRVPSTPAAASERPADLEVRPA